MYNISVMNMIDHYPFVDHGLQKVFISGDLELIAFAFPSAQLLDPNTILLLVIRMIFVAQVKRQLRIVANVVRMRWYTIHETNQNGERIQTFMVIHVSMLCV